MAKFRLNFATYVSEEFDFPLDPLQNIEVSASLGPDGGTAIITHGEITKTVAVRSVNFRPPASPKLTKATFARSGGYR